MQAEGCNRRDASGGMQVEGCKWRVASGGLQVEGCKWRVASGGLQVEGCNRRVWKWLQVEQVEGCMLWGCKQQGRQLQA